jgi:hypothetical protein
MRSGRPESIPTRRFGLPPIAVRIPRNAIAVSAGAFWALDKVSGRDIAIARRMFNGSQHIGDGAKQGGLRMARQQGRRTLDHRQLLVGQRPHCSASLLLPGEVAQRRDAEQLPDGNSHIGVARRVAAAREFARQSLEKCIACRQAQRRGRHSDRFHLFVAEGSRHGVTTQATTAPAAKISASISAAATTLRRSSRVVVVVARLLH